MKKRDRTNSDRASNFANLYLIYTSMKITHVEFSALYNLGDYNNEKVGLRAQLEDGDTVEDAIEQLRQQAIQLNAGHEGQAAELYSRIYDRQRVLKKLEEQIRDATERWNQTAEFLRAQGLNPKAPNLPNLPALEPAKPDEVEAELCF